MTVDNYFIHVPKGLGAEARGSRSYRLRLTSFTPVELITALRNANSRLARAIEIMKQSLEQPSLTNDYRGSLEADLKFLKSYGSLYIYRSDSLDRRDGAPAETLLDLLHVIQNNNDLVMQQAIRKEPATGTIYLDHKEGHPDGHPPTPHPYGARNGEPWATFREMQVVIGFVCPNCLNPIAESDRVYHQVHPGCHVKVMARTAEKTLVKVEFEVGLAARMANLPNTMIPTKHDVWVEPWVAEAARLFQARGEGGYADLTLEEFLAKSRPSSAPALHEEKQP